MSEALGIFYRVFKVQEDQECLKLNGRYRLPACANDVDLLGEYINAIKKNTDLLDPSKDVGLEINADITKYILLSRHRNPGQKHKIKTDNTSLDVVERLDISERL
jgi:hypothetical protein